MVYPATCIITGIIPHGNALADIQSQLNSLSYPETLISGGIPKIIPLHVESDDLFRQRWQHHMEKARKCMGIPAELQFSTPLPVTSNLKDVRKLMAAERSIVLTARPEPVDFSRLTCEGMKAPGLIGDSVLLWGWERGEKKTPSVMNHDEGGCITVKTFQLAVIQLELTDTGLLTWRTIDSCWAPRRS